MKEEEDKWLVNFAKKIDSDLLDKNDKFELFKIYKGRSFKFLEAQS